MRGNRFLNQYWNERLSFVFTGYFYTGRYRNDDISFVNNIFDFSFFLPPLHKLQKFSFTLCHTDLVAFSIFISRKTLISMNFVYALPGKRVIRNSSPLKSKFLILTRESSRNPRFAVSTNFSLKILLEFLFYIDVETLIQNPRYKQYFKTTSQLTFEAWKFARREKKGKKDGQERKRIKRTFSSLTRETTNTDYHTTTTPLQKGY